MAEAMMWRDRLHQAILGGIIGGVCILGGPPASASLISLIDLNANVTLFSVQFNGPNFGSNQPGQGASTFTGTYRENATDFTLAASATFDFDKNAVQKYQLHFSEGFWDVKFDLLFQDTGGAFSSNPDEVQLTSVKVQHLISHDPIGEGKGDLIDFGALPLIDASKATSSVIDQVLPF